MKEISPIESMIIGGFTGGGITAIFNFTVTTWQWWVAMVLLYIPLSQLYGHLRDAIKPKKS